MVQAAYHRKLLKAGMKVHLHRLTLSGCGTRLSDGRTNSASSPSESVAGLPKRGPVSIRGRGPKKSGCKLSGHLDDKRGNRKSEVLGLDLSGYPTDSEADAPATITVLPLRTCEGSCKERLVIPARESGHSH
jgi:hypothetical protein